MQKNLSEISYELVNDSRPGVDGCSNKDRVGFLMEVLDIEVLDINAKFDYSRVVECRDTDTVEGVKHLALLQLEYVHRAYYHKHISIDDLNLQSSVLILAVQKINWHLDHLSRGKTTPPFRFIH